VLAPLAPMGLAHPAGIILLVDWLEISGERAAVLTRLRAYLLLMVAVLAGPLLALILLIRPEAAARELLSFKYWRFTCNVNIQTHKAGGT